MTDNKASKNDVTVLVLAGGSLHNNKISTLKPFTYNPVLLPAGSKLAIQHIVDFYSQSDLFRNIKIIYDRHDPMMNYLQPDLRNHFCKIVAEPDIINTLKSSLHGISTDWILINPVTTLPSIIPFLECHVQVGDKELIAEDWSGINMTEDKQVNFKSKSDCITGGLSWPLTGIMLCKTKHAINLIKQISVNECSDLIYFAKKLVESEHSKIIKVPWYDLGHIATHADSIRSRMLSRAFNSVRYDNQRDLIIKSSNKDNRLNQEKDYIQSLPTNIKRHFPLLLENYSFADSTIEMEAFPFQNLAELYLHWDIGPNAWISIFERLSNIQSEFSSAYPKVSGSSAWLYSDKLLSRFNSLTQIKGSDSWWEASFKINGRTYRSVCSYVDELTTHLKSIENNSMLHLIHGDFCFNNILCEPIYSAIRLIDPRGERVPSMPLPVGFGDSRYDFAKLSHSISGHYDAIINNIFKIDFKTSSDLELQIYSPPNQSFLEQIFYEILLPPSLNISELRLLTSSLFFSMLPLHSEDPCRQLALAYRGMDMFELANAL